MAPTSLLFEHLFSYTGQDCSEHPLQKIIVNLEHDQIITTPKLGIFRIDIQKVGSRWMDRQKEDLNSPKSLSNMEYNIIKEAKKVLKENDINSRHILKQDGYLQHCTNEKILSTYTPNPFTKSFKNSRKNIGKIRESSRSRQNNFTKIWKEKIWGKWEASSDFSSSGEGSTLSWTKKYIFPALDNIINKLKAESGLKVVKVLDIGCGDMVWMSEYLKTRHDIEYTCIDIVFNLIRSLKQMYPTEGWIFTQHDIVEAPFYGKFNLIIIRMVLQNLYYRDINKVFKHISSMKADYALMTTFSTLEKNSELSLNDNPGRYRPVNLEISPFELIPPSCAINDGSGEKYFLGLWKLPLQRLFHCNKVNPYLWTNKPTKRYSCSVLFIYL
ncbi:unnamed protein product [Dimorphilus gyrociliatus]|uniref:Methyltransferase domain-containing protein n=1 Tax=Dimorphilus gyrociliatus TaxID=2664684 RepID=A0A7I8V5A8_9ANNE|nr:unnamed protein product [Dimorphilus gyrociliatus]